MRTRNGRAISFVAGVVVTLVIGGGITYAAIPGPTGVIGACYRTSSGALRVIDSGQSCRSTETAISWNERGLVLSRPPTSSTGCRAAWGTPKKCSATTGSIASARQAEAARTLFVSTSCQPDRSSTSVLRGSRLPAGNRPASSTVGALFPTLARGSRTPTARSRSLERASLSTPTSSSRHEEIATEIGKHPMYEVAARP